MPIILVIVGLVVALGFGGYFFNHKTAADTTAPVATFADMSPKTTPDNNQPKTTTATPPPTPTTDPTATPPSTPTPAKTTTATPAPTKPTNIYRNGTFKGETTYRTPGGSNPKVDLTITVKDDTVTASDIAFTDNNDGPSTSFQGNFTAAYQTQVVGMKLADINLSRVGGASLSTNAFNQALATIKTNIKI